MTDWMNCDSAEDAEDAHLDASMPTDITPEGETLSGENQPEGAEGRFVLGERMTAEHAAELVDAIVQLRGRDLILDASNVTHIATPCLQVLVAAAKSWSADGQRLELTEPSSAFLTVTGQLGLTLDAMQSGEAAPCP